MRRREADRHEQKIAIEGLRPRRWSCRAVDLCRDDAADVAVAALGDRLERGEALRALARRDRARHRRAAIARRPGVDRAPRRPRFPQRSDRARPRNRRRWRSRRRRALPGRTPYWRIRRCAAEACMMPGRSLLRKTSGCSIEPVASTTCRARTLCSRSPLNDGEPVVVEEAGAGGIGHHRDVRLGRERRLEAADRTSRRCRRRPHRSAHR